MFASSSTETVTVYVVASRVDGDGVRCPEAAVQRRTGIAGTADSGDRCSALSGAEQTAGWQRSRMAAVDEALAAAAARVVPAYRAKPSWRDAIRAALHELLFFIDEQRPLALLLLVDALTAGDRLLADRVQVFDVLVDAVDHGRGVARAPGALTRTTAESAVGGVLCILHARLARNPQAPLAGLAGELMSVIIAPYLGPVAASRELRRRAPRPAGAQTAPEQPLAGLKLRLTKRTLLVLRAIAAQPGANNRQIAQGAGITDPGQASKLLSRLQRHALIENARPVRSKGEQNSWTLTHRGASVQWAARRSS